MRAFIIAMEGEAAVVRPWLKAGDSLVVSGIGKVNAAAATQRVIDGGAAEVWNIGVAGGFDTTLEVGEVVPISRAVEYDFDLALLNGTRIGQLQEKDSPYFDLASVDALSVSVPRILATGDRFNDSEDDLEVLRDLGATVRDMEGAAVAHVCERAAVPCRILKCISDVHGKGSMTRQYEQNLAFALERLSAVLKTILA